jgi:5-methylphenazine-1-carboxylate 1-monooxygenase
MRVLIAGGGIGGMATALSLHAVGITEVDIYESAPEIRELGVGVTVQPHAVRELAELGLLDELYSTAIPTAELAFYTKKGQRIWGEPRGLAAGYRWPQFAIHRGQLLGILYQAVVARLGAERVHTGHHLVDFGEQPNAGVWAAFTDRRTSQPLPRAQGDLLVGADGVHSAVRAALYSHEGPPNWNGCMIWRAVTDAEPFLSGRTQIHAGPLSRMVVAFPISRRHESRGRSLINWAACLQTGDSRPMGAQDWDHRGRLADVLEHFGGYCFDWLDLPDLFRRAEVIYAYPMVDRDPLSQWSFGSVTLLGDAAHPMYPLGGNGAAQAIIDARVLAQALTSSASIAGALDSYEHQRRPATSQIVLANRQGGPEQILDIVEQRAPDGFATIEDVISVDEIEALARGYKQTAGFDVDALTRRPSPHPAVDAGS